MKKFLSFTLAVLFFSSLLLCEAAYPHDEPPQSTVEKNLATFPNGGITVLMYLNKHKI